MTERTFRFSQTTTFMQSRSKYYIKYILGLQKKYPDPQRPVLASDIGTIGHQGLEAVYKNKSLAVARRAMKMKAHSLNVYDGKLSVNEAYSAFERHAGWLTESKVDEGYETVAVEKRLYMDMGITRGDRVVLTGAPDLVQRDRFGSLFIRDWKFVADYDRLVAFINANRQGFTYGMLCREEYGVLPIRFDLRQIQRKPPKTKTFIVSQVINQWLKPELVAQHERKLRRTIADMVQLHQEVEDGDLSGVYSDPSVCPMFGPCTDYDVCCGAGGKTDEEVAEILATQYEPKEETL